MISLQKYEYKILKEILKQKELIKNISIDFTEEEKNCYIAYLNSLISNLDLVVKLCLTHDLRSSIEMGNYVSISKINEVLDFKEDDYYLSKIEKVNSKTSTEQKEKLLQEILCYYGYLEKIPTTKEINELEGKELFDAKVFAGLVDNIFTSSIPSYIPNIRNNVKRV